MAQSPAQRACGDSSTGAVFQPRALSARVRVLVLSIESVSLLTPFCARRLSPMARRSKSSPRKYLHPFISTCPGGYLIAILRLPHFLLAFCAGSGYCGGRAMSVPSWPAPSSAGVLFGDVRGAGHLHCSSHLVRHCTNTHPSACCTISDGQPHGGQALQPHVVGI